MALLKGNKRNKLETWEAKSSKKKRGERTVYIKENPAYYVTITYTDGEGNKQRSSESFHSDKSVGKVLKKMGFKKALSPISSKEYENDVRLKKKCLVVTKNRGFD